MADSKRFDFSSLFDDESRDIEYWEERAKIEFAEEMLRRMEQEGVSRAELARRMGTSPAYVTKILRGTTNFTLESMVRVSRALKSDLLVHMSPEGARTHWFDEITFAVQPTTVEVDVSVDRLRMEYGDPAWKRREKLEAFTPAA